MTPPANGNGRLTYRVVAVAACVCVAGLVAWWANFEHGRISAVEAALARGIDSAGLQATDIALIKKDLEHVRWQQEREGKRLDEMVTALEAVRQVLQSMDRKLDRQRYTLAPLPGPVAPVPQAPGGR